MLHGIDEDVLKRQADDFFHQAKIEDKIIDCYKNAINNFKRGDGDSFTNEYAFWTCLTKTLQNTNVKYLNEIALLHKPENTEVSISKGYLRSDDEIPHKYGITIVVRLLF